MGARPLVLAHGINHKDKPNLLDDLPGLSDNAGPSKADNTRHLHGVPSGPREKTVPLWLVSTTKLPVKDTPFSHNIAIEGVENALVSQL